MRQGRHTPRSISDPVYPQWKEKNGEGIEVGAR